MFYNDAQLPADASHTLLQSGDVDKLWRDLEPGGDRQIDYWTCASYVPANWLVGIEDKWTPRLTWQFDAAPSCLADTVLRWEGSGLFCPNDGWVGCWQQLGNSPHADHQDNVRTQILFDRPKVDPHSYAWKTALTAHEWGHNMDLIDHNEVSQAARPGTLMNHTIQVLRPTFQGPTPGTCRPSAATRTATVATSAGHVYGRADTPYG